MYNMYVCVCAHMWPHIFIKYVLLLWCWSSCRINSYNMDPFFHYFFQPLLLYQVLEVLIKLLPRHKFSIKHCLEQQNKTKNRKLSLLITVWHTKLLSFLSHLQLSQIDVVWFIELLKHSVSLAFDFSIATQEDHFLNTPPPPYGIITKHP